MTPGDQLVQAIAKQRSKSNVIGLGGFPKTVVGVAMCCNPNCSRNYGTFGGEKRSGREFDVTSWATKDALHRGVPVTCGSPACIQYRMAQRARLRRGK